MIIQIKQYKYEKTETSSMDLELPEETAYFFETHVRRSIRIKPIFTTWNKVQYDKEEELYYFEVTCVYLSSECKIEKFRVNLDDFKKDKEVIQKNNFLNAWVNDWFDKRTKEQFDVDLKIAIDKINE